MELLQLLQPYFNQLQTHLIRDRKWEEKILKDADNQLKFQQMLLNKSLRRIIFGPLDDRVDSSRNDLNGNIHLHFNGDIYNIVMKTGMYKVGNYEKLRDMFSVIQIQNEVATDFISNYDFIMPVVHLFGVINSISNKDKILASINDCVDKYGSDLDPDLYLEAPLHEYHIKLNFNTSKPTFIALKDKHEFLDSHNYGSSNYIRIVFKSRHGIILNIIHLEKNFERIVEIPIRPLVTKDSLHQHIVPGKLLPCLYNEDLIFDNCRAKVVYFSDLLSAYIINSNQNPFITSHFPGSHELVDDYDWSILQNRNIDFAIVYCDEYELASEIKKALKIGSKIHSICTLKYILLRRDDKSCCHIGGFKDLEKHALDAGYISKPEDMMLKVMKNVKYNPDNTLTRVDLIEGLARVGSIILIAGPANCGKSLISQDLAGQLSEENGSFLEMKLKKSKAAIFDTEIDKDLISERFHLFSHDKVDWYSLNEFMEGLPIDDDLPGLIYQHIDALQNEFKYDVIIIDSLYKFMSLASDSHTKQLLSWANKHTRNSVSVIFVSHYLKGHEDKKSLQERIGGHPNLIRGSHNKIAINKSDKYSQYKRVFEIEFDLKSHFKNAIYTRFNEVPPKHIYINPDEVDPGSPKNIGDQSKVPISHKEIIDFIKQRIPNSKENALSTDKATIEIMDYFRVGKHYAIKQPSIWAGKNYLSTFKKGVLNFYFRLPMDSENELSTKSTDTDGES